jgi:NAD(P)-dependent dehydrogenase (short-subunit alcohol dehydrogenase family)
VGDPGDVAGTVLFLASDHSAFMTGQILRPNGGVAMPW